MKRPIRFYVSVWTLASLIVLIGVAYIAEGRFAAGTFFVMVGGAYPLIYRIKRLQAAPRPGHTPIAPISEDRT